MDDDAFVRAAAPLVHERLADIGSWSTWWPGVSARYRGSRFVPLGEDRRAADAGVDDEGVGNAGVDPGRADDDEVIDPGRRDRWSLRWRAGRRQVRFEADVYGWRPAKGFHLALEGDLQGRAEFWLEPISGGTVVHHLLVATSHRRHPVRLLRTYRRVLRVGLWACKDDLQSQVRQHVGLAP